VTRTIRISVAFGDSLPQAPQRRRDDLLLRLASQKPGHREVGLYGERVDDLRGPIDRGELIGALEHLQIVAVLCNPAQDVGPVVGVAKDVLNLFDEPLENEAGPLHAAGLADLQDLHLLDAARPVGIGSHVGCRIVEGLRRGIYLECGKGSFSHNVRFSISGPRLVVCLTKGVGGSPGPHHDHSSIGRRARDQPTRPTWIVSFSSRR
jgi:hypothetical protein